MKDLIQFKYDDEYYFLFTDLIKVICFTLIIYIFDNINKYYDLIQCLIITLFIYHLNINHIINLR